MYTILGLKICLFLAKKQRMYEKIIQRLLYNMLFKCFALRTTNTLPRLCTYVQEKGITNDSTFLEAKKGFLLSMLNGTLVRLTKYGFI